MSSSPSSTPLNPRANPYISSTLFPWQQTTSGTVCPTFRSSSSSLFNCYWPTYFPYYSPIYYQPKVLYFPIPVGSDPPKGLNKQSPISDVVSRVSSCRGSGTTRRRKTGVPIKARRGSPEKVPEKTKCSADGAEKGGVVLQFPSDLEELEASGKTTVMVKNIPNHFRRRDLIRVVNRHCRTVNSSKNSSARSSKSEYDFLYLPMDFNKYWHERKVSNLGYAFVNFTSVAAAWAFYEHFSKYDWKALVNNKICEVTLAKIQGREALEEKFRSKAFFCHSDEYLPLVLNPACDGTSSFHRGYNVGKRVPTAPSRRMNRLSTRARPEFPNAA